MKISLNWLQHILDISSIEANDLAEKLTLAGFEVDTLELIKDSSSYSDTILDIAIPANRGDTLSLRGLCREISALYNIPYNITHIPKSNFYKIQEKFVQLESITNCFFYSLTRIDNIRIESSPTWLQSYLKNVGMNIQNNILDILNYILIEYGQPIEIFDTHKTLDDQIDKPITINIIPASQNCSFITRTSDTVRLNSTTLVTEINSKKTEITGIIGSKNTEINNSTSSILFEIAVFDPKTIRESTFSLGLSTENSLRFERHLNLNLVPLAYDRALSLIQEITGGEIIYSNYEEFSQYIPNQHQIILKLSALKDVLGNTFIEEKEINALLKQLNFSYTQNNQEWTITIPTHRLNDIERDIDLIEEISRIYGYNNLPNIYPSTHTTVAFSVRKKFFQHIKNFFLAKGFYEVTHYSFQESIIPFSHLIEIQNPLTVDQTHLRSSLLPKLINTFTYNYKQGNGAFNTIEMGRIFNLTDGNFLEEEYIAGILGGYLNRKTWDSKKQDLNWFEAKGIIENFFKFLNIEIEWRQNYNSKYWNSTLFHKLRWGTIWHKNTEIAIFGRVHPKINRSSDFRSHLYLFEINLELLFSLCNKNLYSSHLAMPYSLYPKIYRDINIIVPINMPIDTIKSIIYQKNNIYLQNVELFDDYRDFKQSDHKRLSFRLFYRSSDKTLSNEEADTFVEQLAQYLEQKLH
uniref:phenylalanyl-tRNA synthetase beta subunit n=1 Tax=Chroothece richteriana TaxID=101928 RepID=UPI001FCE2E97|nr:phenylalanyl-tRNA synthetase beta subunit [Chroothece richteriana]UNJ14141.1 phenylalanyl-tRNA synthetase beta subunit [Chroothece richteriana]